MSYLGENNYFSFRDNFCEPLASSTINSVGITAFGRVLASIYGRFAVCCSESRHLPLMFALTSGISECGADVFISDCTDLPSFKHIISLSGCNAGIYISGNKTIKISFFQENGFPLGNREMTEIMNKSEYHEKIDYGNINKISSAKSIYINSIKDKFSSASFPINAGVSCGNRNIRDLWREFFSDDSDTLIFQISDDGQNVNAYSAEFGFISCDRLKLAYSIMLWEMGQAVYLPENFHYAASEAAAKQGYSLKKFNPDVEIPDEVIQQRFLNDMLFMCTALTENLEDFYSLLRRVPEFTTAKREIPSDLNCNSLLNKTIIEPNGKVILSGSGKNRISLLVQAHDAETASEICSVWEKKLRKLSSCNNLFHPEH